MYWGIRTFDGGACYKRDGSSRFFQEEATQVMLSRWNSNVTSDGKRGSARFFKLAFLSRLVLCQQFRRYNAVAVDSHRCFLFFSWGIVLDRHQYLEVPMSECDAKLFSTANNYIPIVYLYLSIIKLNIIYHMWVQSSTEFLTIQRLRHILNCWSTLSCREYQACNSKLFQHAVCVKCWPAA